MSGNVRPLQQPMYQQLQELLREAIESGEFAEGEQFLTERQVVERYRVSRPTANKVLAGMAAEGRLEFRKGVGTFVRRRPLDYDVQTLVSFTQKARDAGRHPSTQVLNFDRVAVTEVESEIASHLRAKPGETLLAVGRLRLADGLPVILERRWLPASLFPGLNRSELRGSIYQVIAEKYQLQITESDQTIRAIGIRGADAKLLQVPPGAAGFLVSAAGYAGDRAVWWERTIYRGDSYEFHHHRAAPGRLISIPARQKAAGGEFCSPGQAKARPETRAQRSNLHTGQAEERPATRAQMAKLPARPKASGDLGGAR